MVGNGANRGMERFSREEGFTLVELLVALTLGLAVVGVAVTVFTAAVQSQPGQTNRGAVIQQGRTTMERLVRELRQGSTVYTATAQQLSFITFVDVATCGSSASGSTAIPCRVTYSCASGSCTRVVAQPDGTDPSSPYTIVSGLSDSNVFTYSPSATAPSYIGATLIFPASTGDDAITLSDGATLRNSTPVT